MLGPTETRAGAGQRVERLAVGLRQAGWTVELTLTPAAPPAAGATAALVAAWKSNPPDVVYIEVPGPWSEVWRQAAVHLGRRLVVSWHGVERFAATAERTAQRVAMEILAATASVVVVESVVQQQGLIAAGWASPPRIPAGIDRDLFHPRRRSADLRRQWGATEAPVLLHVGRLLPEKNIDLLIATLTACRVAHPQVVAVVVGDGPSLPALRSACPWVQVLGIRTGEDLARIYASADLFLFPSQGESWGNVVVEALASGVPVVAFATGCVPELMVDGVHGRVVTTAEEFIAATCAVVADPSLCPSWSAAAPAAVADIDLGQQGRRLAAVMLGPVPRPWAVIAAPDPEGVVSRLPAFGLTVLTAEVTATAEFHQRDRFDLIARLIAAWSATPVGAVLIPALDAVGQAAAQAAETIGRPWVSWFRPERGDDPAWFRRAFATFAAGPMEMTALQAAGVRAVLLPPVARWTNEAPAPSGTLIIALVGPDLVHLPALVAARLTSGPVDVVGDPALAALAPGARVVGMPADLGSAIAAASLVIVLGTAPRTLHLAAQAVVAGTPLLAVRQPALAGLVEEGVTGLLVERVEALVAAAANLGQRLPAREGVRTRAPWHHPDRATAILARVLRHAATQL